MLQVRKAVLPFGDGVFKVALVPSIELVPSLGCITGNIPLFGLMKSIM
jgi:hypothetical protein